ncbi:hypothetical protein MJK71_21320 [Escherichia coli]|nr:hypothetical protein MJK71_21320 [Escherichia coli]
MAAISAVRKSLLQKQKEGKKRMKQIGNVELPQEGVPRHSARRQRQQITLKELAWRTCLP